MIDWMDYGKIQEYKRNGLKKSQVARRLEVDYKTILKYWDMSPTEYAEAEQASKKRRKKADEYKDFGLCQVLVGNLSYFFLNDAILLFFCTLN